MRGPAALLALEDGSVFAGTAFGAEGESFGEAVFNTGMAGYQEVLTDPSYAGQIVAMTYPLQGNYGMNTADPESAGVQVAGFAVRETARRASSWRADSTLQDALVAAGVIGIEGIDTRRLTRRLREAGAMRAAISTVDLDERSLLERVRATPGMIGADLARTVTAGERYEAATLVGPASTDRGAVHRVAAYDFGIKRNILRLLADRGDRGHRLPGGDAGDADRGRGLRRRLPLERARGPGRHRVRDRGDAGPPREGAVVRDLPRPSAPRPRARRADLQDDVRTPRRESAREARPDRRGGDHESQPRVRRRPEGWTADPDGAVLGDFGRIELTHWNLNDGTLEGLRCLDVPAFSVQYHPEAAPGPHDSRYLFEDFRDLIGAA